MIHPYTKEQKNVPAFLNIFCVLVNIFFMNLISRFELFCLMHKMLLKNIFTKHAEKIYKAKKTMISFVDIGPTDHRER